MNTHDRIGEITIAKGLRDDVWWKAFELGDEGKAVQAWLTDK